MVFTRYDRIFNRWCCLCLVVSFNILLKWRCLIIFNGVFIEAFFFDVSRVKGGQTWIHINPKKVGICGCENQNVLLDELNSATVDVITYSKYTYANIHNYHISNFIFTYPNWCRFLFMNDTPCANLFWVSTGGNFCRICRQDPISIRIYLWL